MKTVKERLFKLPDREEAQREVDEELRFHLDLMTDELCRDMPSDEARATAQKRFGNVEQIRDQCVEISRRRHPAMRALKLFLILIFLVGVLVRVFSPEYHLTRVGDILMAVGFLSRLLFYVRGLNPSNFISKPDDSSPLKLVDSKVPFTAYDQSRRTPVERVISYK